MFVKWVVLIAFLIVLPIPILANSITHEWKLDEISGSVAYDSIGNANCSLINFENGWTDGKINNSLEFNSTLQQYLDCGNDISLNFSDNFSIDLWIDSYIISETYERLFIEKYDYDTEIGYYFGFDNALLYPRLSFYQTDNAIQCRFDSFDTNNWHHLALTYGNDFYIMYGDGIELCNLTQTQNLESNVNLLFGGSALNDTNYYFYGRLDNIRFWNNTLNDTEVENLYLYNSLEPIEPEEPELPTSNDSCLLPENTIYSLSCFNETLLLQSWILNNQTCYAYQNCQYGCDNVTSSCSPPAYIQDMINVAVIIILFVFFMLFIKWSRK